MNLGTIFKDFLIPGITALTAVGVVYLNFYVSEVDSRLKENQDQRAERESVQSLDLKIYEKVIQSLESEDPKKQQVAQTLVQVMASDSFRVKLLTVLEQAATDTVRKEVAKVIVKENKFKVEEETKTTVRAADSESSNWKSYNYDVFWCESSGESARAKAAEVVDGLSQRGVKGRCRVRQLPASVNSRSGYQIAGYVIRANQDEEKVARELQSFAGDLLEEDMTITYSRQATPYYISAFVCP